MELVISYQRR